MTTKRKIILGFMVMIILMAALSVFGYFSLQTASSNFNEYRRLARLSELLSDTVAEMNAATTSLFQFTTTDNEDYVEEVKRHYKNVITMAGQADTQFQDGGRKKKLSEIVKNTNGLQEFASSIVTNLGTVMDEFNKVVSPTSEAVLELLVNVHDSAQNTGNATAASLSVTALREMNGVRSIATGLSQARDPEEYPGSEEAIDKLTKTLDKLSAALITQQELNKLKEITAHIGKLRGAVQKMVKSCASYQQNLDSIDKVGDATNASLAELNKDVTEQRSGYGTSTIESNSRAQNAVMGISAGGIALGILVAALLILGLVRVLRELGMFAEAIASGNFNYAVKVKEKGEVGQMVGAMQQIPGALNAILAEYQELEKRVESGELKAKGDPGKFSGDFATLVKGTNSILERFVLVLESIPSPVVMLNRDLKATYLNTQARELAGEDYNGKTCFQLFARDDFNTDACGLKRAVESKRPASGETGAHPQGRNMDISYTAIPMYDKAGALASVLQLITDLTAIKQTQRTIMNVASQASGISSRVAAASEQLSAQVEQVSRGAEMQRTRVESTASAMTEMNATVLEVAQNASRASEQSENTRSKADNGSRLVNQVVQAINVVNKVTGTMQTNMQGLGAQAESIGGVMNIISDIADQTNLLALNAAIEAARAGEAGRGFAVVADEVRKLAEKTMSATNEVGSNITAIQHSTRINIDAMADASKAVTEATELANASGTALNEIVGLASANSSVVTSIATAAEQQSATSEEISLAINEINQIVGETTDGMVQASAAVQELSQMAQELNRIMAELK